MIAIPASSANMTPVVIIRTVVWTAVRRTSRMHSTSERRSWIFERRLLALEPDVCEGALGGFLGRPSKIASNSGSGMRTWP